MRRWPAPWFRAFQAECGDDIMFNHQRHQADQPTAGTLVAPTAPVAVPKPEDGLDKLCLSDIHAIEVEEISAVEFVREWGRAITKVALAHSVEKHDDKAK